MMLAMQLGSGKAELDDGWIVQVSPKSVVTATARPLVSSFTRRLRSSRMLSIRLPSDSCTTCASVVLGLAPVPTCYVSPPSLL